jgi:hypothetical protein
LKYATNSRRGAARSDRSMVATTARSMAAPNGVEQEHHGRHRRDPVGDRIGVDPVIGFSGQAARP